MGSFPAVKPMGEKLTKGDVYTISTKKICAIGSINSHYFHIIGDEKVNPIVGVYIPIITIPIKGEMTIPNIATFDHGTYMT